jgi:hypothetical protein
MKTFITTALAASITISAAAYSNPDSLGLPGDGLDLRATLNLFKESKSPEEFEKKLNQKDNHVNNLDLNKVHDISKDNVHALVLQVPVNAKESQDVAVIEIEKRGTESAALQIVGDEELYGEEYVVQPKPEKENKAGDDHFRHFSNTQVVFVNVWHWPCVHYIYSPSYVIWISPWYWAYYPMWWDPWAPYPFYTYYGWTYVYYDYYYCCAPVYVLPNAHQVYQPRRVVSQTVVQNNREARNNRPATKPNRNVGTPAPQEAPRDQSRPVPQQQKNPQQAPPQRRDDVTPAPQPVPQPAPRPRPDVRPPQPRPAPASRPMPAPRPTPRPR